jgi:hypothetical protein
MPLPYLFRAGKAFRFPSLAALCLSVLLTGACVRQDAAGGEAPGNPNEKNLAYDVSIVIPTGWTVSNSLGPEAAPKAALEARRQKGEQIQLIETSGAPGARGLQPSVSLFITNEQGAFIPRSFAEKLSEADFESMAKKLMEEEKKLSKKDKRKNTLLEMRFSRDSIGGHLAVMQRMLVAGGPDGKPVRFVGWDVYLPNGAGLAVRCAYDQETPGAENEVINVAKSLRVR